jgi:rhodanese-related sulfurtransferase
MKKRIMIIFLLLISLGITACSAINNTLTQEESEGTRDIQSNSTEVLTYTDIKPEDAKKRLDNEKGIILLDVRTQEEYSDKHIPYSMLIPVEVIEKEAPSKLVDKNITIFVYCRSGRRSVIASEALVKMGYTKVYNLGGINDWTYEIKSGTE